MDFAILILSVIIALVLCFLISYYNYYNFDWKVFEFTNGDHATFDNIKNLRFNKVHFEVTTPDKKKKSIDVTYNLNAVAVGRSKTPNDIVYDTSYTVGGKNRDGSKRKLNAFSFQIKGVNDPNTLSSSKERKKWKNAPCRLYGMSKTLTNSTSNTLKMIKGYIIE